MKTNQEIQAEGQRLFVLGVQYQREQIVSANASVVAVPRVLLKLPTGSATPTRERHIEAAVISGALIFRLMEHETGLLGEERIGHAVECTLLASSPSAHAVLSTGYERAEEERLAAMLDNYSNRGADRAVSSDEETVAEVEGILETKLLPAADRIRTKAEIVEFLEGRLERAELIGRNIDRQYWRECYDEDLTEMQNLKLTTGEP